MEDRKDLEAFSRLVYHALDNELRLQHEFDEEPWEEMVEFDNVDTCNTSEMQRHSEQPKAPPSSSEKQHTQAVVKLPHPQVVKIQTQPKIENDTQVHPLKCKITTTKSNVYTFFIRILLYLLCMYSILRIVPINIVLFSCMAGFIWAT